MKTAVKFDRWNDSLLKKVLPGFLLFPLLLTGCELKFSLEALEDLPLLDETKPTEIVMQGMVAGQQAYYQANGHFAATPERLSIDFKLETQEYRYALITEGELAQTVIMTASAKAAELPSYAGVVTVDLTDGGAMAFANVCKTDQPSFEPPQLSTTPIPGEGLKCPPGSSPVR